MAVHAELADRCARAMKTISDRVRSADRRARRGARASYVGLLERDRRVRVADYYWAPSGHVALP